jgi:hypothetical protein
VSAAKQFYLQLTEVEQAFKELKGDLAVRPIYHQFETRIESHIFISFLAYCLQVTLKARLKKCAAGLTPRAVLEKFAAVQMIDVHLPTTDEREIIMSRYTQPEKDLQLLLDQLKLTLPEQGSPKMTVPNGGATRNSPRCICTACSADLLTSISQNRGFRALTLIQFAKSG